MNKVLTEVVEIIMGQSPPSSTYNTQGKGIPFFQGKADFGEMHPSPRVYCTEPNKTAEIGDILISVRAPVGPTNVNNVKSCIGRGLAAIRCRKDIDSRYLLYFLRSYETKLSEQGTGSTFDAISRDDFDNIIVPLPPLPEQQRIVALLGKADRLRRLRRYALEMSAGYLQAVFMEMFGDPVTNPMGWDIIELNEFLKFLTSGPRGWAEYYSNVGARFIRSFDVQMNFISETDKMFVTPPDNAEAKRTIVHPKDVLLTITGSKIGRVAAVPSSVGEAYVSQHVAILRLSNAIDSQYLSMYLSLNQGGQRQIEQLQYGQTKPGLSLENIREFAILSPPLSLQQKFVKVMHKHERLRAQQREALRQAEHLFQTLLARTFARNE